MGLTVSTGDARAAQIMGAGGSVGFESGNDANSTNGAQTIWAIYDREGTPVLRVVRGVNGTTNLVLKNADGEDCFVSVAADQTTLSSSATVVA